VRERHGGAGPPRCGREVTPRYDDVRGGHRGCKWCAWQATAAALRMDHEIAAVTMIERHLEPLEQYPGSSRLWRCRCLRCGAEVTPRYETSSKAGAVAGRAAGRRPAPGSEARRPPRSAVMRAAGPEPLEPYRNAMTPWRSQCRRCGREVSPLLNNIKNGQGGCIWCARGAVDPEEAGAFMRAAGLEPLTAYPGRAAPWPCRCQRCHQAVSPRYGAVRNGSGCRYCNDTAIKPDAAAALMRAAALEPLEPYPGSQRPWKCRCAKCGRTV